MVLITRNGRRPRSANGATRISGGVAAASDALEVGAPAAFQIDDRKPAHGEAHPVAEIKAVVIRASMTNSLVHARDLLAVNRSAVTANNACYATHFVKRMMKVEPGGVRKTKRATFSVLSFSE